MFSQDNAANAAGYIHRANNDRSLLLPLVHFAKTRHCCPPRTTRARRELRTQSAQDDPAGSTRAKTDVGATVASQPFL